MFNNRECRYTVRFILALSQSEIKTLQGEAARSVPVKMVFKVGFTSLFAALSFVGLGLAIFIKPKKNPSSSTD